MRFMNSYDLDEARSRFTRQTMPNRLALVMVVDNLREATDEVSDDGWAYWSKPANSAASAMALIDSTTFTEDITDAEMTRAVMPIKAMLTRNKSTFGAERRERILRSVTS